MVHLTQASQELFRRSPDERFESLPTLFAHCRARKKASEDLWKPPHQLQLQAGAEGTVVLQAGDDGAFALNDWSFSQVCRLAGVAKDTVNRLSPDTASRVLQETLPRGAGKPLQLLTTDAKVRSVHGVAYTRLWDADLVQILMEFAVDFQPPQQGYNGATGLYAGEQDLFCFLIDPAGWAEIDGENFAPGFFVWNSEVGKRSVGISTFWFQAVCQNHIVWDATEVVEFSRKHTANVHESLSEIRRAIDGLVQKRDARKDGFVNLVRKAMREKLGDDAEEVENVLARQGITRQAAKEALGIAQGEGRFTIWSLVDALTRLARRHTNAGERADADQRAAKLFELAV